MRLRMYSALRRALHRTVHILIRGAGTFLAVLVAVFLFWDATTYAFRVDRDTGRPLGCFTVLDDLFAVIGLARFSSFTRPLEIGLSVILGLLTIVSVITALMAKRSAVDARDELSPTAA